MLVLETLTHTHTHTHTHNKHLLVRYWTKNDIIRTIMSSMTSVFQRKTGCSLTGNAKQLHSGLFIAEMENNQLDFNMVVAQLCNSTPQSYILQKQ